MNKDDGGDHGHDHLFHDDESAQAVQYCRDGDVG